MRMSQRDKPRGRARANAGGQAAQRQELQAGPEEQEEDGVAFDEQDELDAEMLAIIAQVRITPVCHVMRRSGPPMS
jgi:hypothetical protein